MTARLLLLLLLPRVLCAQSHWVDSTLNALSLEQQIGQLFMLAAYSNEDAAYEDALEETIRKYHAGGLIFFQGTPERQALMTNRYQRIARVPLMIGMDAENGIGWRLSGCIKYPDNISLGAVRDDRLAFRIGRSIGRQCQLLGVHVNFAPVADVNVNPWNPVIGVRSFGEGIDNVSRKAIAYAGGLSSRGIMAVAKHFPGHGDTSEDSHLSLPRVNHLIARIDSIELHPFKRLFAAGVPGVLVAHIDIPAYDPSHLPASLSHEIVTRLLREQLHFNGLCFTDAMNMKGVTKGRKKGEADLLALLAGNDVILFPEDIAASVREIKEALKRGIITEALIRERCRRVLMAKEKYVLPCVAPIDTSGLRMRLNAPDEVALKQEVHEKAITLVKNDGHLLPLSSQDAWRVASINFGDRSAREFEQALERYASCTHLSISRDATDAEISRRVKQLAPYDCIVIYNSAARNSAASHFGYSERLSALVRELSGKRLILCHPAVPYGLQSYAHLPLDAILLSYSHDPMAQDYMAQAIFGGIRVDGQLPASICPEFPVGFGLITNKTRLGYHPPELSGMNSVVLRRVDSICRVAIEQKATPGCQVLVARNGFVVYNKAFGHHTYEEEVPNAPSDIYDVASVTKIMTTLPAIMMLHDRQQIALDSTLACYLPFSRSTDKGSLTIRELLLHMSGLKPALSFFQHAIDPTSLTGRLLSVRRTPANTRKLRDGLYITSRFRFRDSTFAFEEKEHYLLVSPGFYAHEHFLDSVPLLLHHSELSGHKRYAYSDIGFIFLQQVVEEVTDMPLDAWVRWKLFRPIEARDTDFLPLQRLDSSRIVPSSNDQVFRKSLLHGHVHDPTAALLGGVAGNAGLFSTAEDLAKIMTLYLNHGVYGGQRYIDSVTIALFSRAQLPADQNRRGLGFDKPETLPGKISPVSASAPATSYGHSGFTGVLVWNDPDNQLTYVFLSNRTYPNEYNDRLYRENIRSQIQEVIYASFADPAPASSEGI
jgi:beta-glucosidase-like glycosyl hydrolase/CubicO group peptidase (beta-lactamase class C family)